MEETYRNKVLRLTNEQNYHYRCKAMAVTENLFLYRYYK